MTAPHAPPTTACWVGGVFAAWVVQIFGTSAALAIMRNDVWPGFLAIWSTADAVGPAAKIGFVAVLALLLAPVRRAPSGLGRHLAVWVTAGALAVLSVLALLPTELSRGFGIGLGGTRFALDSLPIYLGGAMAAGAVGALVQRRCCLARETAG